MNVEAVYDTIQFNCDIDEHASFRNNTIEIISRKAMPKTRTNQFIFRMIKQPGQQSN
jgi:wobble nucleotide-excising tRNase